MRERQSKGYEFHLIFLYLQSAELAVERVRERVRIGGHIIPENVIRRRYLKDLRNFSEIYQLLANSWRFFDASDKTPQMIAFGDKIQTQVLNEELWKKVQTRI